MLTIILLGVCVSFSGISPFCFSNNNINYSNDHYCCSMGNRDKTECHHKSTDDKNCKGSCRSKCSYITLLILSQKHESIDF